MLVLASSIHPNTRTARIAPNFTCHFFIQSNKWNYFYYMSVTFWKWLLSDVVISHLNLAQCLMIDAWIITFSSLLYVSSPLITWADSVNFIKALRLKRAFLHRQRKCLLINNELDNSWHIKIDPTIFF